MAAREFDWNKRWLIREQKNEREKERERERDGHVVKSKDEEEEEEEEEKQMNDAPFGSRRERRDGVVGPFA